MSSKGAGYAEVDAGGAFLLNFINIDTVINALRIGKRNVKQKKNKVEKCFYEKANFDI